MVDDKYSQLVRLKWLDVFRHRVDLSCRRVWQGQVYREDLRGAVMGGPSTRLGKRPKAALEGQLLRWEEARAYPIMKGEGPLARSGHALREAVPGRASKDHDYNSVQEFIH